MAAGATYLMLNIWQALSIDTAGSIKTFYKNLFSGETIEKAFIASQFAMKSRKGMSNRLPL